MPYVATKTLEQFIYLFLHPYHPFHNFFSFGQRCPYEIVKVKSHILNF